MIYYLGKVERVCVSGAGEFFGGGGPTNKHQQVRLGKYATRKTEIRKSCGGVPSSSTVCGSKPPVRFDIHTAQPALKQDGQPQQERSPGFPHERTLAGRDIEGKLSLRLASSGEESTMVGLTVCIFWGREALP